MNTKSAATIATVFALTLGITPIQADATASVSHPSGRVIHLGTIVVTPPKAAKPVSGKFYGSTAFLGTINVTIADSADGRLAARAAKSRGAMYLGVVQVGREDSLDARYAQRLADERGAAYLGSVQVAPVGFGSRTLAGLAGLERRLADNAQFVVFGALAFNRAGG